MVTSRLELLELLLVLVFTISQLQHSTPAPGTEEQTTGSWGTSRSRVDFLGPWLASLHQK